MDREEAIKWIRGLLDDKRFYHSLRTEEMALLLARKYGFYDFEKISIAAILHDCAKSLSHKEALEKIDKYGIILDDVSRLNPLLWHALIGEKMVRYELGIEDEEILNAIRVHTTGSWGMTLLEKIIFVADKVEFGRNYEGIEFMRELAWFDLDRAVSNIVGETLCWVVRRGLLLHNYSVDAWNGSVLETGDGKIDG